MVDALDIGQLPVAGVPASWAQASVALGDVLQPDVEIQPCPICDGRLGGYQDSKGPGSWHYCFECGLAGDATFLAAAVWDVSYRQAAARIERETGLARGTLRRTPDARVLRQGKVLKVLHNGLVNWQDRPRALAGCRIQKRLPKIPPSLLVELVSSMFGLASLRETVGKWQQGKHRAEMTDCRVLRRPKQSRRGVSQKTPCVVVPCYDRPGRVASLLFVPGRADARATVVSTPVALSGATDPRTHDGYGFLSSVMKHEFEDVVLCADPRHAVRLQTANAVVSNRPLPLLWWEDGQQTRYRGGRKGLDLDVLDRWRTTLWVTALGPRTLNTAILTDSKIHIDKTLGDADRKGAQLKTQPDTNRHVAKVMRLAKPWLEVLREIAGDCDNVYNLLRGRGYVLSEEARELIKAADPDLGRRVSPPGQRSKGRRARAERSNFSELFAWNFQSATIWSERLVRVVCQLQANGKETMYEHLAYTTRQDKTKGVTGTLDNPFGVFRHNMWQLYEAAARLDRVTELENFLGGGVRMGNRDLGLRKAKTEAVIWQTDAVALRLLQENFEKAESGYSDGLRWINNRQVELPDCTIKDGRIIKRPDRPRLWDFRHGGPRPFTKQGSLRDVWLSDPESAVGYTAVLAGCVLASLSMPSKQKLWCSIHSRNDSPCAGMLLLTNLDCRSEKENGSGGRRGWPVYDGGHWPMLTNSPLQLNNTRPGDVTQRPVWGTGRSYKSKNNLPKINGFVDWMTPRVSLSDRAGTASIIADKCGVLVEAGNLASHVALSYPASRVVRRLYTAMTKPGTPDPFTDPVGSIRAAIVSICRSSGGDFAERVNGRIFPDQKP